MNYEYKKRKNDDIKLITSNEAHTNSTKKLLKREYPYIIQSMKNENYIIEYDDFEIIQEILYDEKVVGIISLIKLESFDNSLCINEAYIMPEYRKKGLFYQILLNLLSQPNMTLSLRNPNKNLIDLLIEYELAKKLDNNIVVSYVNFQVDYSKRYINDNIKEYYKSFEKDNQNELIRTNFYDLNINSSIFFDMENIIIFNDNPVFIEKARQIDSEIDKYFLKLKNMDMIYLDVLLDRLINVENVLEEFFNKIEYQINENLNVNDILGTDTQLTDIFKEILEKNNLSINDGFAIRADVIESLKNNEIIPKSIILRTMYLIEHFNEDIIFNDKKTELGNDFEEKCPYCLTENNNILEVCKECGYNIQLNNHFLDNLPHLVGEEFFSDKLNPDQRLRTSIDYQENKLNDQLLKELYYMEIDEERVFNIQRRFAVYQLLKDIAGSVYFDIFDYDRLNYIRGGSCFNYALKQELISPLKNYQIYYEILEMFFSDDKLKNILLKNNLNIDGSRNDLIFRIESRLSPIETFGKKYFLTSKGKNFLKKHEDFDYYNHLDMFNFYEFLTFKEKYSEDMNDFENSFIEYMHDVAIRFKDYRIYHKILYYNFINMDKKCTAQYLISFTMLFITDINYWLSNFNPDIKEKPLSNDVINLYPEVKHSFVNKDINLIFNNAYNSIEIDFLKDNYDLVLFYLIKSLSYEDIEDINREIEEFIFEERFLKILLKI